jgi:hypothetical protein
MSWSIQNLFFHCPLIATEGKKDMMIDRHFVSNLTESYKSDPTFIQQVIGV